LLELKRVATNTAISSSETTALTAGEDVLAMVAMLLLAGFPALSVWFGAW
jgi:hypothetical protein